MPPHLDNFFVFLVEMGFYHVSQASLKLPISGDPPALASQSAGVTGVEPPCLAALLFSFCPFYHSGERKSLATERDFCGANFVNHPNQSPSRKKQ